MICSFFLFSALRKWLSLVYNSSLLALANGLPKNWPVFCFGAVEFRLGKISWTKWPASLIWCSRKLASLVSSSCSCSWLENGLLTSVKLSFATGSLIRFSWTYLVSSGSKLVNLLYRKGASIARLEFADETIAFVDFGKSSFWSPCAPGNCVGWFAVLETSPSEDNVTTGL